MRVYIGCEASRAARFPDFDFCGFLVLPQALGRALLLLAGLLHRRWRRRGGGQGCVSRQPKCLEARDLGRQRVGADFVLRRTFVAVLDPRQLFELIVGPLVDRNVRHVRHAISFVFLARDAGEAEFLLSTHCYLRPSLCGLQTLPAIARIAVITQEGSRGRIEGLVARGAIAQPRVLGCQRPCRYHRRTAISPSGA